MKKKKFRKNRKKKKCNFLMLAGIAGGLGAAAAGGAAARRWLHRAARRGVRGCQGHGRNPGRPLHGVPRSLAGAALLLPLSCWGLPAGFWEF